MYHVSRLMKNNNSKFHSRYFSRKSLQVRSSMLPLFSDKFKIRDTHQREIKNLLFKTNNKRNIIIESEILFKKVTDFAIRSLITRYNTIFKSYRSWITKSGL